MKRILSWAGTAAFLPVFGAILLVFDPAQRIARLFGQRPQEYVAGTLQMALVAAFRLCGVRLAVERAPGFVPGRSYVVVSNHQSMFDWIPSVSYNLRRGGHVLIDRGDAPGAVATIRELGRRVQAGGISAVIFPEGTRSRAGELREFRRAGTLALLETAPDVPVVPITIDQSWRLLAHNMFPIPWGVRVRVRIGEPIARRPGDATALVERVREEMLATLARWRGGAAPAGPA